MKKAIIFIIIFACILSLHACSDKTILIAGISEGSEILSLAKDDINLSSEYKKLNATEHFEYKIDNETIIGNYQQSIISPYYNCDADIYETKGIDGKEIEFRVNRNTKKVVSYMITYRDGYKTTFNKSYEECLQIAKDKLSEFDDGTYDQVLQETHLKALYIPECGYVYSYYFSKTIDDKPTNILVQIDVNTDGLIIQVNATDIFEFNSEDITLIKSYNYNDASLTEEIKNTLLTKSKSENTDNISFDIQKSFFCKLKNGKIYIMCEVKISIIGSMDDEYIRVLKKLN